MIDTGSIAIHIRQRDATNTMPLIQMVNQRPSGLIQNLIAQGIPDLRRTVSVLYALCPIAHVVAMDMAAKVAVGEKSLDPATEHLYRVAVSAEAVVENLRVLLTDGAEIAQVPYATDALRRLGRLRTQLAMLLSVLLSEKTNAEQVAHVTESVTTIAQEGRALFEALLGQSMIDFYRGLTTHDAVLAWMTQPISDETPLLVRLANRLVSLPGHFGLIETPWMPSLPTSAEVLGDELYHRLRIEPGFDMMPVLDDQPQLTGAIVRQQHHAGLAECVEAHGVTPATLFLARLLDTVDWLEALSPEHDPHALPGRAGLAHLVMQAFENSEGGLAMLETARGLLTHARGTHPNEAGDGKEAFYAVTSPTEWQFSPEGPATQALQNAFRAESRLDDAPLTAESARTIVRLALFGLDACVPVKLRFDDKIVPMGRGL